MGCGAGSIPDVVEIFDHAINKVEPTNLGLDVKGTDQVTKTLE